MMNERFLLMEKLPKRGKDSPRKIDLKGKKERHQSSIIFLSIDIQILNDPFKKSRTIEELPSLVEIVLLERKIGEHKLSEERKLENQERLNGSEPALQATVEKFSEMVEALVVTHEKEFTSPLARKFVKNRPISSFLKQRKARYFERKHLAEMEEALECAKSKFFKTICYFERVASGAIQTSVKSYMGVVKNLLFLFFL